MRNTRPQASCRSLVHSTATRCNRHHLQVPLKSMLRRKLPWREARGLLSGLGHSGDLYNIGQGTHVTS